MQHLTTPGAQSTGSRFRPLSLRGSAADERAKAFRHLLIGLVLLFAQIGALTHALEHQGSDATTPAGHACALCLVAQGLNAPLASVAPAVGLSVAGFAPPTSLFVYDLVSPDLTPRARAPPQA